MADEKEKLDIEDIKDPDGEELDIDNVVSEEIPEEAEVTVEEPKPEPEKEHVLEEPAKKDEETQTQGIAKKPKSAAKKGWVKYAVIGATVALVGAAGALGYMYYLQQKNKEAEVADANVEEQTTTEPETTEEIPPSTEEFLYINSEVGLNLRETANTKAAVLAIIPFGTKITVLEEQTNWVKTTYEGKTGWVSVDFTQATDPLVYSNTAFGFELTFKAGWGGYKFIEYKGESSTVKTYYVCLPTTDKVWDETSSGVPKGYASLFVMGVYTKAEWEKQAGGEMLPAKLGESDKYVYTYLPGQAHASDLATQYAEVSTIIKSFEVLN